MSKVQLLDKGHVSIVQHMGSDEIVCRAARQSTDGAFRGWGTTQVPGDEKFLKYLWLEKHTVPFEHCVATFEIKAPIFVLRQLMRHRTFSYSEMSGRYTTIPSDDYVPSVERLMLNQDGSNKQANRVKGAPPLSMGAAESWAEMLRDLQDHAEDVYQSGLALGVPKELARGSNTVNRYSQLWMTGNLLNWLKMLILRRGKGAQAEIVDYADVIHNMLAEIFPRTLEIFDS